MNLELAGRVVVVLGAASGIGCAIAQSFVKEGARVVALDRSPAVTDVAQSMVAGAEPVTPVVADVTDYEALQKAVTQIESGVGPVDHVVFTVGIGSGKYGFPFWNLTPADRPKVLEVNVFKFGLV